MRLARAARRTLNNKHKLALTISVSYSQSTQTDVATLTLNKKPKKKHTTRVHDQRPSAHVESREREDEMSLNRATTTMHSLTTKTRLFGLGLLLAGFMIAAPSAHAASFGIQSFSTSSSSTQAGAHANLSTSFTMNTDSLGNTVQQTKDVKVTLPPGVVGNPQAIPKCTDLDFQAFNCPADSQVGILNASFVTSPGVGTTMTAANIAPTTLTAAAGPCNELCHTSRSTSPAWRGSTQATTSPSAERARPATQGLVARPSTRR